MAATMHQPRRARLTMFTVAGAAALSIAACSSNTTSPPSSSSTPSTVTSALSAPTTTTPAAPRNGESHVTGLIESVSGNTAQVSNAEKGKTAVGFSDSTKVTEATDAALTDVTPGSCISVLPSHDESNGPVTAASLRLSEAKDGKCPQAKESGSSTTPPSATTAPGSPPAKVRAQIKGTVAAVSGNTINVTTEAGGNTPTAVTVNDKTKYTKQTPANTQAIAVGKCLTAWGTKDGSGTLQATRIDLVTHAAKCEGRPHHGG